MISNAIADTWKAVLRDMNGKIFGYQMTKPVPSEWTEQRIILPEGTTVYPGPFSYQWTPYAKHILDNLHPASPTRYIAVMKSSQCGITAGVVIPAICYIIEQTPDPILFTAADLQMAGRTIAERLDPILRSSKLDHLIRPNVIKKSNNRTGDTKFSKEYAGGTLTALGTNSADSFRFFSARYVFADDFDTAPHDLGGEGAVTKLIEGRQKSYGNKAKTFYISTPKGSMHTSHIFKEYQRGTMRRWSWKCPACPEWFPVEFFVRLPDGNKAGIIYELDDEKNLIHDSVHYSTQCCGHRIEFKDKHELNLKGEWISSNPKAEKFYESYLLNDLVIPVSFDDWVKVVIEWLEANPPGQKAIQDNLKVFNNTRLGLPFEEIGDAPKSNALMLNQGVYAAGVLPDETSATLNETGKIILITAAFDLNGELDDARIDWEIVAHCAHVTYSVDHGSIGTFKRAFERRAIDIENDDKREKLSYDHGRPDSIWPHVKEVIANMLPAESGKDRSIDISVVDTGQWEKQSMQFVSLMREEGYEVWGIKGRTDQNYRSTQKESQPVRISPEQPNRLYIAEVNQLKDDLSEYMGMRFGQNGYQPSGFMNFPAAGAGKYQFNTYFVQYEGERRVEVKKKETLLGYQWKKKHSNSVNHFWDVRVYNLAAPYIWLDRIKRSDPGRYKTLSWEDFVNLVTV